MSTKVYQVITNQIIELLESGVIPWEKPWTGVDHKNMVSKKPYRGLNPFMLQASAIRGEYQSNYWLSYNQAKGKGGQVRKGEKSTLVIFWKWFGKKDEETGEVTDRFPMLRYYRVFNVDQVDWPEGYTVPVDELPDCFEPIANCEALLANMPHKPKVNTGDANAYYSPRDDEVTMPIEAAFKSTEAWYSVLFHELVHSTGHPRRLGRFETDSGVGSFGSESYSKEELVAEMGAAMLCGVCGIETTTINNHAAYIKSWVAKLKDDNKMIVQAASQAQKAADYMRNITYNDNGEQVAVIEREAQASPDPIVSAEIRQAQRDQFQAEEMRTPTPEPKVEPKPEVNIIRPDPDFIAYQSDLAPAIADVKGSVHNGATLPVLSNIKMVASKDDRRVVFIATDLESFAISRPVKCKVNKNIETTIPAKTFHDLMRTFEKDDRIEFTLDYRTQILRYTCTDKQGARISGNLKCIDACEFPPYQVKPAPTSSRLNINAGLLKEFLRLSRGHKDKFAKYVEFSFNGHASYRVANYNLADHRHIEGGTMPGDYIAPSREWNAPNYIYIPAMKRAVNRFSNKEELHIIATPSSNGNNGHLTIESRTGPAIAVPMLTQSLAMYS